MTSAPPRILCIGTHHKTGTVWMRRVWRLIGEALDIPFVPVHNPAKWHKIPSTGRVIVVNWAGSFAPELFDQPDARFLHIIRDPRDVLLSGARYHETSPGRQERFLHGARADLDGRSYQEHLQALPDVEAKLAFEMQNMHLKTLTEMLGWPYGHPRALDLRYEDMIADHDCAQFIDVLRFFGLDQAEIETARQIYFENSLFGGLRTDTGTGRTATHVNSGAARQWPAALPLDTARLYLDRHGEDLITLGYEADKGWLARIETVPLARAAGGSA
ncbi:sulfotransferase domain-containing protein [Phaeobacter sp. B1627]|uniref:sulfotransferase domain-containing protein n=1 Tax=Phaeobacter sp. B1627 TaxID=2583809 RepID=UPI00210592AE|nr:sulfotransferase domain-containing protein [Phaeobacter sp. B1627]